MESLVERKEKIRRRASGIVSELGQIGDIPEPKTVWSQGSHGRGRPDWNYS